MHYRRLLTVAGSDSCGGAGIQADLKTFSALGCYGMSVITAVTVQNTLGVGRVHPIPERIINQQLDAVLNDIGADAVKIGMLYSGAVIRAVAGELKKYGMDKIVLDPVMAAQSGGTLLQEDALAALKTFLLPICRLVTPNLPEAEILLSRPVATLEEMRAAAVDIAAFGPRNVLIKGGHSRQHPATDVLYLSQEKNFVVLNTAMIPTQNNHGTGCTLSSAVAAYLSHGLEIEEAVRRAKRYISKAIDAGAAYRIGKGHGPVHHFFDYWT